MIEQAHEIQLWMLRGSVYYSTIQISFSDLKKEIGNHSVISIFHFQFENENQKIGSIFRFSFIIWNWKSENWTYFLIFILQSQKLKWKIDYVGCTKPQLQYPFQFYKRKSEIVPFLHFSTLHANRKSEIGNTWVILISDFRLLHYRYTPAEKMEQSARPPAALPVRVYMYRLSAVFMGY